MSESLLPVGNPAEFDATDITAALTYTLENGAAKIGGIFSEADLSILDRGATESEWILSQSEGLESLIACLGGSATSNSNETSFHAPELVGGESAVIHIDSLSRYGLSLLVPLSEEPGTFGADNSPYDETDAQWPRVLLSYKRRDVVLVRQDVSERNGMPLREDLPAEHPDTQAYHYGASPSFRKLRIIDLYKFAQPQVQTKDQLERAA